MFFLKMVLFCKENIGFQRAQGPRVYDEVRTQPGSAGHRRAQADTAGFWDCPTIDPSDLRNHSSGVFSTADVPAGSADFLIAGKLESGRNNYVSSTTAYRLWTGR